MTTGWHDNHINSGLHFSYKAKKIYKNDHHYLILLISMMHFSESLSNCLVEHVLRLTSTF